MGGPVFSGSALYDGVISLGTMKLSACMPQRKVFVIHAVSWFTWNEELRAQRRKHPIESAKRADDLPWKRAFLPSGEAPDAKMNADAETASYCAEPKPDEATAGESSVFGAEGAW